ncbi:hypothetical protein Tco_0403178, partial [Tanacetum coccineum]
LTGGGSRWSATVDRWSDGSGTRYCSIQGSEKGSVRGSEGSIMIGESVPSEDPEGSRR